MRIRSAAGLLRTSTGFATALLPLFVLAAPAAPASGGASPAAVRVPASIDATGARDVTAPLQQFLAGVPDGSAVQFAPKGSYRVNGTLLLQDRHDLTIDGNGARVFASTRGGKTRSQWYVLDGSNIVFRDLAVQGANPRGGTSEDAYVRKLETQHGFRIEGTDGVQLDHVAVSDVYGDFVYIGRDPSRVASRSVWIHDSDFARNGRQGIAVVAAADVIIEHNQFDQTRRSTIDLEPNARSWHVSDVFVLNNTVGKGRLLFVASHGQGPVDDIVISGNQLKGHALTIDVVSPENKRRSNWIITNNTSDTTVHSRPLRFAGIDGLMIQGNTQRVDGEQAVALSQVCGARVQNNNFGPKAGVRSAGKVCAAPLAIPNPPDISGRAPSQTRVPAGPRGPVPATPRSPVPAPVGSSAPGMPLGAWIFVAALAVACAVGAIWLVRRNRRGADA